MPGLCSSSAARRFVSAPPAGSTAPVSGLGAGAVGAAFAFGSIMHGAHESILAAAVNLSYPVGDVFLLLLVVSGTPVMSGRRKAPWLLLAVNSLGDTSNLLHHTPGSSHLATTVDAVAWPTSTLLISLAMWLRPGPADPLATRKPPGFLLPGLAAGAGPAVLFLNTLTSVNRVATGLATATLLLVVVRTRLSVRHLHAQSNVRQRQSITNPLTGLANRPRLFEALDGYFAQPPDDRPSGVPVHRPQRPQADRRFLRPPGRRRDSQPCQRPTRTVTALD